MIAAGAGATGGAPDLIWVNGIDTPQVAAIDRGLQYGDGLFETITCRDERPRFTDRHFARLELGARQLGLPQPPRVLLQAELARAAQGRARCLVKLLLTRGEALGRGYATSGAELGTRVLLRYAWPPEPSARAREGVRVRIGTLRFGENPRLARIKHLNRLEQVLARSEWTDSAVFESLHASSSGHLASGTMSNVFLVIGERLLTPAVDRCGIAGVMREIVLEAARRNGIAVSEERLPLEALSAADEIFLTNVRIGVVPVTALDARSLPPGRLTRRLQELTADAC